MRWRRLAAASLRHIVALLADKLAPPRRLEPNGTDADLFIRGKALPRIDSQFLKARVRAELSPASLPGRAACPYDPARNLLPICAPSSIPAHLAIAGLRET